MNQLTQHQKIGKGSEALEYTSNAISAISLIRASKQRKADKLLRA